MSKRERNIILFIVFLFLGTIMAVQSKGIVSRMDKSKGTEQIAALRKQLEEEKKIKENLVQQIDVYDKKIDVYLDNYSKMQDDTSLKSVIKERDYYKKLAGLTDVRGEGVIVTLNDAPVTNGFEPEEVIIHDEDLNEVLNELKKAGAQAISVNGERIISMSKHVCAGPTVMINDSRYPVPFVIKAIGNSESLYKGISESDISAILDFYGIQVKIEKSRNLEINRYQLTKDRERTLLSGLEVVE